MESPIWVPFASALVGAVVGGLASFGGSIFVDRLRLRREMRVRLYDGEIRHAVALVSRWHKVTAGGNIDRQHPEALAAIEQVRRSAVVAGKKDRRQVQQWVDAYHALGGLSGDIDRHSAIASGLVDPTERRRLLDEARRQTQRVLDGLTSYEEWLQERLN